MMTSVLFLTPDKQHTSEISSYSYFLQSFYLHHPPFISLSIFLNNLVALIIKLLSLSLCKQEMKGRSDKNKEKTKIQKLCKKNQVRIKNKVQQRYQQRRYLIEEESLRVLKIQRRSYPFIMTQLLRHQRSQAQTQKNQQFFAYYLQCHIIQVSGFQCYFRQKFIQILALMFQLYLIYLNMGNQQKQAIQTQISTEKPPQPKSPYRPVSLEIIEAIQTYERATHQNQMLFKIISHQEILELQNIIHQPNGQAEIRFYKPNSSYPLLNPLRRTIWKLLLIMPSINSFPAQNFLEDYEVHKRCSIRDHDINVIQKDVPRTFPESTSLSHELLKKLLIVLYGNVFKPLGYYSGESLILGFLLQCGFNEIEAYSVYIALKVNKKFQFVRKIDPQEKPKETIAYKLGQSFTSNLQKKYPYISAIFSQFSIQIALLNISDFMCLCCNWDYAQIGNVAMIWDFIICYTGQLCSIACILTELAKIWYDKNIRPLPPDRLAPDEVFKSWVEFPKILSKQEMGQCLSRVTQDFVKHRAIQALQNFRLINPLYKHIYQKKQSHDDYLMKISGPLKKYTLKQFVSNPNYPERQDLSQ